jgi:hypothetical protein
LFWQDSIDHFCDIQRIKDSGHYAKVAKIVRLDIQIHAAPFKKGISAIYLKIFLIFMK